jgi:formate hydrogenlyase subunit 3/multisubunit Na+/H+ antiporter MnhD subunit
VSAPLLWIFLPAGIGLLLFILRGQQLNALIGGIFCLSLAIAAFLLPIDTALAIGALNLKIAPSVELLGRRLALDDADRALLVLVYGVSAFWFMAAASVGIARRVVHSGLILAALLVAALAVEPFLYAALLIEVAVLFTILVVGEPGQKPGKGALRFLIYQTLAMPFILFAGWLLTGLEANPGDVGTVTRATTLLGMGFALLLAIFPFHTWIPLLAEETHPYLAGFILWVLTTAATFFGLGFLDRYTWLRESPAFLAALKTVGVVMVASGGLLAAFQRHLGRLMGYAVIIEAGFSLLAIGLGGVYGFTSFLLLLAPRALGLALWAYALSVLYRENPSLDLDSLKSAGHSWPFAAAGLTLATLSLSGLPILASFPSHQAVWLGVARQSLPAAVWVLLGSFGLTLAVLRLLTTLFAAKEETGWQSRETWPQKAYLLMGSLLLFLLGLFPHWAAALWLRLPAMFEHLGQ